MITLRRMVAGCLFFILAACEQTPTPTAAPAAVAPTPAKALKLALIVKARGNPFFDQMEKGARQAAQEAKVELVVKSTDEETAIEQQINLVDGAIAEHVNGIVIAPVDSKRLVPALKRAQDAGIRIVNVDNRLDSATMKEKSLGPIPFISIDNERAAYASAKYIADRVHGPAQAAILEGIRHADNANQRLHGAERAFAEQPKLEVVVHETANWSADEAYAVAKRIFGVYPGIRVVFCANDMMAFGLLKYLKEAGRHDVLIASFDDLDEAKRAVLAGELQATVDQQADRQGYQGVMTDLQAIKGDPLPAEVKLDAQLVTAASLKAASDK